MPATCGSRYPYSVNRPPPAGRTSSDLAARGPIQVVRNRRVPNFKHSVSDKPGDNSDGFPNVRILLNLMQSVCELGTEFVAEWIQAGAT